VKPLAGDAAPANAAAAGDDLLESNADLQEKGFPLIDFHAHLKGGLTLDEALQHSRKVGINYGIAANCGVGFPITRDEDLLKYLASLDGKPVFKGMQAEGREWVKLFSREAISKADYVFTDAMTFTDDWGKRTRLWIKDEVEVKDKEAFMEMYMDRILKILSEEPIDIFVNPTFLPDVLRGDYDALWTEARMDKIIAAAVKNRIAIEINSNLRLPSAKFLRRAKAAGAKFSLGTNNGDARLGRLEYSIQMVRECGLTSDDMFLPGLRASR
jgi:hypothetical protein